MCPGKVSTGHFAETDNMLRSAAMHLTFWLTTDLIAKLILGVVCWCSSCLAQVSASHGSTSKIRLVRLSQKHKCTFAHPEDLTIRNQRPAYSDSRRFQHGNFSKVGAGLKHAGKFTAIA